MKRSHFALVLGAALLVAAGSGVGITLAVTGQPGPGPTPPGTAWSGYPNYAAMMGGVNAPQWMMGGAVPGPMMMGGRGEPDKVMGSLLANAPGPRTNASDAARLGDQSPVGATVDRAQRRIVFSTTDVRLAVLASPASGPDQTFRIAGLVNPTLVVPVGARVSVQVINADPDMAHGLVVTAQNPTPTWMPMMTTAPAFAGAAVWALGDPTSAGLHTATLTFTADTAGSYAYLCAVPGHAQKGMIGAFVVQASAR